MTNRPPDLEATRTRLILVVDDSPEMRALIHDVLTDERYEVITASSGGGALSHMAERVPDLVITDLIMPGMNGFTLRGEMLRRPELAHVPVIVLSAFWQRPSETLDVVDIIAKPLDLDRLLDAVARATGRDAADVPNAGGVSASAARTSGSRGRRRPAGRVVEERLHL